MKSHSHLPSEILDLLQTNKKPLTITQISELVGSSRITIARVLDHMLLTGLVQMRQHGQKKKFFLPDETNAKKIISYSPHFLVILSPTFTIQWVNEQFLIMSGLSETELINHRIDSMPLSLYNQDLLIYQLTHLSPGETKMFEDSHIEDGILRIFQYTLSYVPSFRQEPFITLTGEEITRRKNLEKTLSERDEQLKTLTQHIPGIIFQKDFLNKQTIFFNDSLDFTTLSNRKLIQDNGLYVLESLIIPEDRDLYDNTVQNARISGQEYETQYRILDNSGIIRHVMERGKPITDSTGTLVVSIFGIVIDITEKMQLLKNLQHIEWMLSSKNAVISSNTPDICSIPYDLSQFNTDKTVYNAIGKEMIADIARDYMDLLGTVFSVLEKNGDYAYQEFSTGWCRLLHSSSKNLCTDLDPSYSMRCGKWICHESCKENSIKAMKTGVPVDTECPGGLNIYSVPITAGEVITGCISIGYGNPPNDSDYLYGIADLFEIPISCLFQLKQKFDERPPFIVEYAKKRVQVTARLFGEIIYRKKTEQKLVESEEKYRKLFENSGAGITIIDWDGTFLLVNKLAAEHMGALPEEIIGKTLFDFLPEDTAQRYLMNNRQIMNSRKRSEYEDSFELKTGKKTFLIIDQCLEDSDGHSYALQSSSLDITERKQIEEALKESKEKFKSVFDNSRDVIYRLNLQTHKYEYYSPACIEMYGFSPQEMISMDEGEVRNRVHPDDVSAIDTAFMNLFEKGYSDLEIRWQVRSGDYRWLSVNMVLHRDEAGNPLYLDGFVRNITPMKIAEKELYEREEKYRAVFAIEPDSLMLFDQESGVLLDANQSACTVYGYTHDEIITLKNIDISAEPEKTLDNFDEFQQFIPIQYHRKKDGTIFPVEISASQFSINGRSVMLGVSRDISQRLKMENDLVQSEQFATGIYNSVSSEICILDQTGTIISVNDRWKEFAESNPPIPANYGIGSNYLEICDKAIGYGSEGAKEFAEGIRSIIKGDIREYIQEYPCHSPTEERYFIGRVTPLTLTNKDHIRVIITHEDISQRKKSEMALIMSELKFKEVLAHSPDVLYSRNLLTDSYDYMSPAITEITGYSVEEMISMPIDWALNIIHPDDIDKITAIISESLSGEKRPYSIEYRIKDKKGEYRWFEDYFVIIRKYLSTPTHRMGCVRDITDRKKLEQKLSDVQEITEFISDPIYISTYPFAVIHQDGTFYYCNQKFLQLLGYTWDEIATINSRSVQLTPPEWIEAQQKAVELLLNSGSPVTFDKEYFSKDGTRIPVTLRAYVNRDEKGTPKFFYGFVCDRAKNNSK